MRSCVRHPDAERYSSGTCKQCSADAARRWRARHPEAARANSAKWHAANPDKSKAANARWRAENAERHKRNQQKWVRDNREKARAMWRKKGHKAAGIDPVQAAAVLAAHGGACDCCGRNSHSGKGWSVDHDHQTGRIRGVLCSPCNLAIGQLGDTLEGVLRAVKYLSTGPMKGQANG